MQKHWVALNIYVLTPSALFLVHLLAPIGQDADAVNKLFSTDSLCSSFGPSEAIVNGK